MKQINEKKLHSLAQNILRLFRANRIFEPHRLILIDSKKGAVASGNSRCVFSKKEANATKSNFL